jgi:hypothetical protein
MSEPELLTVPAFLHALVRPSAWGNCPKRGCWVVVRYSSTHEKAMPNEKYHALAR